MDVKDILTQAKNAVEEANIPEALRPTAFAKAIDILSGQLAPANGTVRMSTPREQSQTDTGDLDSAIDRIAKKLNLDPATVAEVFHVEDGEIHILSSTNQFSKSRTVATQEIALLVVAGRQAAGLDVFTKTATIRPVVDHFGKFDQNNFAKHITAKGDWFGFKGDGQSRLVKMKAPGWEAATALVQRLGGDRS